MHSLRMTSSVGTVHNPADEVPKRPEHGRNLIELPAIKLSKRRQIKTDSKLVHFTSARGFD